MSEANTVFDLAGRIVATAKHGVAWSRHPRRRLGEYDDGGSGRVYDHQGAVVGHFSGDGRISDSNGAYVGHLDRNHHTWRLFIGEKQVARCIGCPGAAAAALLLLFFPGVE